jgi:ubiquitin C-terminal hydrolase
LPVKNEFEGISNDSIEKAIYENSKSETLTGDNAYSCSGCDKKVTASKGTHLDKLPKILTL